MYTKAIVYSKADCPHCNHAVMVLNKAGIEVEKKIRISLCVVIVRISLSPSSNSQ